MDKMKSKKKHIGEPKPIDQQGTSNSNNSDNNSSGDNSNPSLNNPLQPMETQKGVKNLREVKKK